jgi:hypothetical protein
MIYLIESMMAFLFLDVQIALEHFKNKKNIECKNNTDKNN